MIYETENKPSEYSYNEIIFIKEGFYKGRYARIEAYNTKLNQYVIRIRLVKNEDEIKVNTKPEYIRKVRTTLFNIGKH